MDIFLEYMEYMKTNDTQSTYCKHPILAILSTVVKIVTYVLILMSTIGESWYKNYKADLACHSIYISLLYGIS